jgi:5'-methylthioadenosine phosphorylase
MSDAAALDRSQNPDFSVARPRIAIIGGSGVGEGFRPDHTQSHEVETPFGYPSAPILQTTCDGVDVLLLARHGPGHVLNPGQVPFRANIFALKQLGATHVIATAAIGSLREEFHLRDLVIPDQIIDKTAHRPRTFYEKAAVHVEFADPFCPILRRLLLDASAQVNGTTVHDGGCYVCMEGPAFSTRAESHMHRLWGGDLIGMTLMPEAKLAREAELPYAAVCLVTDYDCWRPRGADVAPHVLLEEIVRNLNQAGQSAMTLIRAALALVGKREPGLPRSPAHDALALGIWSDKRQIDGAEIRRLWPLWGRHFAENEPSAVH